MSAVGRRKIIMRFIKELGFFIGVIVKGKLRLQKSKTKLQRKRKNIFTNYLARQTWEEGFPIVPYRTIGFYPET